MNKLTKSLIDRPQTLLERGKNKSERSKSFMESESLSQSNNNQAPFNDNSVYNDLEVSRESKDMRKMLLGSHNQ